MCAPLPPPPPPKKDFKTRKKEKHATKIPSSRGLFIEDSSVFFVSGPRVKKKRGEKEKRENSKKITGKNRKRKKKEYQKKKRSKSKKDKSARVHVGLFFLFFIKRVQKQKASQTQIYHKKRHKMKENFVFIRPFSPCRRKWLPLFVSLSFKLFCGGAGEVKSGEIEKGGGGLKNRTQPFPPNLRKNMTRFKM